MAIVLTTDGAIQSVPANTPIITAIGDVLVSDKFNRAGVLFGSNTDSFYGGTLAAWAGTADTNNANITKTESGGMLELGSTNGTFSTCVNAGRADLIASMKFLYAENLSTGQNSMFELRKASASTGDTYRIGFGNYLAPNVTGVTFSKRVNNAASIIANLPNFTLGTVIKVDMKGGRTRIYYNDILQLDYTDPSPLAGTFFGFAGSSLNRKWQVTDFILRSN
jgi:hypothetical protein